VTTAPAAAHVLTDQGVPIGWSIIPDHPLWAYLSDYEAGRPATPVEMVAMEEQAYREYAAAMAANAAIGTAPRGPWPVARAAVTAPETAAALAQHGIVRTGEVATQVTPSALPPAAIAVPAPESEPQPEAAEDQPPGSLALLNVAYHAASGDEPAQPAEDPAPAPGAIAQMAAETNGLGEMDKAQEVAFTAFSGAFDADPEGDGDRAQPDATAQIEAVGDATEVTPAVTEVAP
jgi:hypothetical protein